MSDAKSLLFVDTNILVYAFDRIPSAKQQIAKDLMTGLIETDRVRLSTQVLQELYVTLTRKARPPCSPAQALAFLDDLAAWPVATIDYYAIREAVRLSASAIISFWDALVVVSAARSGASILYTEDLNHGQVLLGVEIVNPFRAAAT